MRRAKKNKLIDLWGALMFFVLILKSVHFMRQEITKLRSSSTVFAQSSLLGSITIAPSLSVR